MKTKYLLIVLACFIVNACQSNSPNQSAARNANASQSPAVTNMSKVDKQIAEAQKKNAGSGIVQPKYYPGIGTITQIDKKNAEVELNHEEIQGKMPAAKTKFLVMKNEFIDFLKDLKVGDKVNFILMDDSGSIMISTINKIPATQK